MTNPEQTKPAEASKNADEAKVAEATKKKFEVIVARVNWLTEPLSEDPKVPARYIRYKTGDIIAASSNDAQIQRYLNLGAVRASTPVQNA